MNTDPTPDRNKYGRGNATAARASRNAPRPEEEELETGEPIPDEDEPKPAVKKIPAKPGRFGGKPAGPGEGNGGGGGGQMVLASAKYLKTNPEPADRNGKKSRSAPEPDNSGQSLEGRLLNGSVGGGLLAMIVAVIWFIAGLMNDILFFYPPILFVIGLIAFFKGMAKNE